MNLGGLVHQVGHQMIGGNLSCPKKGTWLAFFENPFWSRLCKQLITGTKVPCQASTLDHYVMLFKMQTVLFCSLWTRNLLTGLKGLSIFDCFQFLWNIHTRGHERGSQYMNSVAIILYASENCLLLLIMTTNRLAAHLTLLRGMTFMSHGLRHHAWGPSLNLAKTFCVTESCRPHVWAS